MQERIKPWCDKAIAFRILRDELRSRVDALLDWGWKSCQVWDANRGSWRGGPTPGQGCNTVGQVARLWPELLAFFPPDEVAVVRNSKARSRLPEHIAGYGTPEQFRCEELMQHDNGQLFSAEEMQLAKRRFAAINMVLTQMSLMKDVPNVDDYPDVEISSHLR